MILVVFMLICGLLSTLLFLLDRSRKFRFSALCYMFYGSMLMWSVDLGVSLWEEGTAALGITPEEAVDDLQLTASVTALALVSWLILLASDWLLRRSAPRAA